MIDCSKVRKLVISFLNPDNTTVSVTKYFDIDSGDELTANQVKGCVNIQSIDVDCAVICDPT